MATNYLTKTLTTYGNSFGFSGTVTIDLDPALTKITERIKGLYGAKIDRPRSKTSRNNYAPTCIIVDLKQTQHFFDIIGVLTNDTGNISGLTPTTTSTAVAKKNVLIAFKEQGGAINFYHRNFGGNRPTGSSYPDNVTATAENVFIEDMSFEDDETEVNTYGGTAEETMKENEQRIKFTMTLRRGKER